jgi:putative acetyltransferase
LVTALRVLVNKCGAEMIREYDEKDLNQLLDVWFSASQIAHPFLDEAFFERERRNIADLYLPKTETWVYEVDGVVVGFIALNGNEVGGLFVDSKFHRQGIGRALMDKARNTRDVLELDVFKANLVGRKFYERYGFIQVAEHLHEETGFIQLRLNLKC